MADPALEAVFHLHHQALGGLLAHAGQLDQELISSRSTLSTNWVAVMPERMASASWGPTRWS